MTGSKGSVLIVEDEALLLDIVADEIEEEGFAVIRAMTAESALAVLEGTVPIDVLFTDIRLPGAMNGWRLAERARQVRGNLAVMYATGYSDESPTGIDRRQLFLKPYRVAAIVQAIHDLVVK